jgi:hypothetical protein
LLSSVADHPLVLTLQQIPTPRPVEARSQQFRQSLSPILSPLLFSVVFIWLGYYPKVFALLKPTTQSTLYGFVV